MLFSTATTFTFGLIKKYDFNDRLDETVNGKQQCSETIEELQKQTGRGTSGQQTCCDVSHFQHFL